MVHVKVALSPAVTVTPEVADVASVIVAVPLVTVHNPVPTVGVVFPDKVNVSVSHCVISVPASDVVGNA